jgi:two-component system, OmpR family, phosphate regulon sensor histidine kinase PhoR
LDINLKPKRNLSPNSWTLVNSISIVVVLSSVYISTSLFVYNEIKLLPLLITDAAVFLLSLFIYRYILEKFIYEKIRLIYKTILTTKKMKGTKGREIDLSKDVISDVNEEVLTWVQDKKEEIEELQKLENYRREFLGNVSHELKTPLFNIQGYTMTLLEGGLADNSINREYLVRTEKNIDRMIAIIEDLEAISQYETGELELNQTKFDIYSLSREVADLLETKAGKRGIRIYFRDEETAKPLIVFADKERIRQVLINLIDNSIKYGTEKTGSTKVSFFMMDENLLIEITDDGIGIEAKDIPRLFERFFRVDKSRSREQGGSGLGLAIVKHIIEAHGQTISVRSLPGRGSTFGFTLPVAD